MKDFPTLSYSYFEKVVGKGARDNPERYCGWFFCVHGSLKKFEGMAGEAMDVCLPVLKESNKSRFDCCSVRNSVLIISHITFRDCRLHTFSDNLSRKSSILQLVKSLPSHIPEARKSSPFGRSLPVKAIIGSTPPGDFHYLKEKLHVYAINDIQLLKMNRLSWKSLGEQEHPRLDGSENLIII